MREQPELTVTEMATSELVPYANNAKIHTREQVEQIAKSIDEFGFNDPVGVWRNGKGELEIIEGHGRVLAAQRLGLGKVPVIELSHLSDAQRRAYTHVHNQLNMNTGWDMDMLALELGEIEGFDWEDFGFELPWDDDDGSLGTDEIIEDDFDDEAPARAQKGDLWRMGNHLLFCGDSTDPATIGALTAAAGGGR